QRNRDLRERLRDLQSDDRTTLLRATGTGSAGAAEAALRFADDGDRAHLWNMPYENLDALLGRRVPDHGEEGAGADAPQHSGALPVFPDQLVPTVLTQAPDESARVLGVLGAPRTDDSDDTIEVARRPFRVWPRSGQRVAAEA